jgi:hypothetical protein
MAKWRGWRIFNESNGNHWLKYSINENIQAVMAYCVSNVCASVSANENNVASNGLMCNVLANL